MARTRLLLAMRKGDEPTSTTPAAPACAAVYLIGRCRHRRASVVHLRALSRYCIYAR